jgi:methylenetetrahydrofolate reductase (NADPH)
MREEKKVNAGAQFLQTQVIFDVDGFEQYLEALERREVTQRVKLLAGITPVRSHSALQAFAGVPGIKIPAAMFKRLESAADPKEESVQMTLEIIERVKKLPGVAGFHFMAVGWESIVPRLVRESGLR